MNENTVIISTLLFSFFVVLGASAWLHYSFYWKPLQDEKKNINKSIESKLNP